MRPIPVAFHIWFLEVHTYGIGLALTFWFGLRYTERRLRKAGYPWQWVTGMFVWVIIAAIVGARALHVLSMWGYYTHNPGQIIAIWQGGLSSFGGILFAVPVALVSARRRCPQLPLLRFADLMAPVLMACWGIGRLLGPQLMVAGGGHPTNQWFGMYYAGQHGKRLPVPIFQSMEDLSIFAALLLVERWLRSAAPVAAAPAEDATPLPRRLPPAGIVIGVGMVLWGIERFLDEHLWLGEDGHLGSILTQIAGITLAVAGVILLISRIEPFRRWRDGAGGDLAPVSDTDVPGPDGVEEDGVAEQHGAAIGAGDTHVAGQARDPGELQDVENSPVVSAGAGATAPGGAVLAPGRAPAPGDLP